MWVAYFGQHPTTRTCRARALWRRLCGERAARSCKQFSRMQRPGSSPGLYRL